MVSRSRPVPPSPLVVQLSLLAAVIQLSSCDALRNDQFVPLWGAAPFLLFLGVGGLFIFNRRRSQLSGWDLRQQAADPGISGMVGKVVTSALVLWIAFAVYNVLLPEADPSLKISNIVAWLLGSALGVILAILFGLRFAERSLTPPRGQVRALPRGRS